MHVCMYGNVMMDDDDDDDVDDDDNDDDDEIHLTNSSLRKAGQFKRTSCFFLQRNALPHTTVYSILCTRPRVACIIFLPFSRQTFLKIFFGFSF